MNSPISVLLRWCINTECHLQEARRLKALSKRLPPIWPIQRRWIGQTQALLRRMAHEIAQADGIEFEYHNTIYPPYFLASIPDVEE